MIKLCLMSGAFLNAGDFLIERRSLDLIKHFIPNSDVTVLKRVQEDYTDKIGMLNQFDAIIFAGGPIYQTKIYPNGIPFVKKEALGGGKNSNILYWRRCQRRCVFPDVIRRITFIL